MLAKFHVHIVYRSYDTKGGIYAPTRVKQGVKIPRVKQD